MRTVVTCDFHLKYALAQSAALSRSGAGVLLLCRDHALEFGGDTSERCLALDSARDAGVSIVEIPGRLWDFRATPQLRVIRKRVASFGPEVVHAHAGADPRAIALLPNTLMVLTIHDPEPHRGQEDARFPPKRWVLHAAHDAWVARASAIIVHSERLCEKVRLHTHQRCLVVPHGLDVRDAPLPVPSEPTVAFLGRLEPYKGLNVLARAMQRVWARRPAVRLKIAGSGPSAFPLADPRVEMDRRYLPEAAVGAFFAEASLVVLPYTEASQTGVGSRAVGYGVPVIASRLGGLPDLVLDQTYLVEAGDDLGLADAILGHIDDTAEIRARVLSEVAAPRSWEAAAARSVEVYDQLLAESAVASSVRR